MDKRQAIGSWLSGPPSAARNNEDGPGHRGKDLGLPESGPGSVAPTGRRVTALFIDWMLCYLIAYGLIAGRDVAATGNWIPVVFVAMTVLLVGTVGVTPGKRALGIRVAAADGGGRVGFGRTLVRTLLVILVIPAVIQDGDGRGLHDRFGRSVEVRI
jgi:uncharacterized RDD family membrane protein YckC